MIEYFRKKLSGKIAIVFTVFLAVVVCLWGIENYTKGSFQTNSGIHIGSQTISATEIEQATYQLMQSSNQNEPPDQQTINYYQNIAKHALIKQAILSHYLEQNGYNIANQSMHNIIVNNPNFQENGHFSKKMFTQHMQNRHIPEEIFMASLKKSILLNQLRSSLTTSAFTTNNELNDHTLLQTEHRDFTTYNIPVVVHEKTRADVSQKDIENYYSLQQIDFKTPAKTSIEYILFSTKQIKIPHTPSTKDLTKYFQKHYSDFSRPEQFKLHTVQITKSNTELTKQEILTLNGFLSGYGAQKASLDKLLKSSKNLLAYKEQTTAWLDKTLIANFPEEIKNEITKLTSIKSMSSMIKLPNNSGYLLIKIEDKRAEFKPEYKDVASDVQKHWELREKNKQFKEIIDKAANISYTQPTSLQAISEQFNLKVQTTELFSTRGGDTPLTQETAVIKAAFNPDIINMDYNSEPVQLTNGDVIILRKNTYEPTKTKNINEVKTTIIDILAQKNAIEKAKILAEKIKHGVNNNISINKTIKQHNINKNSYNKISPVDTIDIQKPILQNVFTLPAPKYNNTKVYDTITLSANEVVLIQLNKVWFENHKQIDDKLEQKLEKSQGEFEFHLYTDNILEENKSLLKYININ